MCSHFLTKLQINDTMAVRMWAWPKPIFDYSVMETELLGYGFLIIVHN